MQRSDFHYELPPELIAQAPLAGTRARAACSCSTGATGASTTGVSPSCRSCLRAGDLLVLNDTRVLPARVYRP